MFSNIKDWYGIIGAILLLILVSNILTKGWAFQSIIKQTGESSVGLIDALTLKG